MNSSMPKTSTVRLATAMVAAALPLWSVLGGSSSDYAEGGEVSFVGVNKDAVHSFINIGANTFTLFEEKEVWFLVVGGGGGGGASFYSKNGADGGSGGGAAGDPGGTGGAGTEGQGYAGGDAVGKAMGGGGGAGGPGEKGMAANGPGAAGGIGRISNITGEEVYYAGGGGGGGYNYTDLLMNGGLGGGGNGVRNISIAARKAYTLPDGRNEYEAEAGVDGFGGGGGGANNFPGDQRGRPGGRGTVIIRVIKNYGLILVVR